MSGETERRRTNPPPSPARWPNSKGFSPRPTRPSSITAAAAASPLYRIPTNLCYFLSSLGLGRHCRVDGKRGIRGEEGSKRGIQPTHSAISGRVVSGGLWTLPQIGDRREGNKGRGREEVNGLLKLERKARYSKSLDT